MFKIIPKFSVIIIGCIFFISILVSLGAAKDKIFVCDLKSNKIGPKPAETEAIGTAIFQFDENNQELTYKLIVENIEDLYMAHLHIGPSDKEGELAVWLYPAKDEEQQTSRCIEGKFSGILAEGIIKPGDLEDGIVFEELMKSLNEGNAYVNVHTKKFVMGAIRGQAKSEDLASY